MLKDVSFGRAHDVLTRRERIKKQPVIERRRPCKEDLAAAAQMMVASMCEDEMCSLVSGLSKPRLFDDEHSRLPLTTLDSADYD
jgi:hypothetical protein